MIGIIAFWDIIKQDPHFLDMARVYRDFGPHFGCRVYTLSPKP